MCIKTKSQSTISFCRGVLIVPVVVEDLLCRELKNQPTVLVISMCRYLESPIQVFSRAFFGGSQCVSELKRMNPRFWKNRVDLNLFYACEIVYNPLVCVCIDMNPLNMMGVIMTWNVFFSLLCIHQRSEKIHLLNIISVCGHVGIRSTFGYQHLCSHWD